MKQNPTPIRRSASAQTVPIVKGDILSSKGRLYSLDDTVLMSKIFCRIMGGMGTGRKKQKKRSCVYRQQRNLEKANK